MDSSQEPAGSLRGVVTNTQRTSKSAAAAQAAAARDQEGCSSLPQPELDEAESGQRRAEGAAGGQRVAQTWGWVPQKGSAVSPREAVGPPSQPVRYIRTSRRPAEAAIPKHSSEEQP